LDVDILAYIRKPGSHDPLTSRVRVENTFKTLEMHLHFDSDV